MRGPGSDPRTARGLAVDVPRRTSWSRRSGGAPGIGRGVVPARPRRASTEEDRRCGDGVSVAEGRAMGAEAAGDLPAAAGAG